MSEDSKFEILHDDIKDVQKTLTGMNATLVENTTLLRVQNGRVSALEDGYEEVHDHVVGVKKLTAGTTWIAGIVSAIAGFIWAIGNLF